MASFAPSEDKGSYPDYLSVSVPKSAAKYSNGNRHEIPPPSLWRMLRSGVHIEIFINNDDSSHMTILNHLSSSKHVNEWAV